MTGFPVREVHFTVKKKIRAWGKHPMRGAKSALPLPLKKKKKYDPALMGQPRVLLCSKKERKGLRNLAEKKLQRRSHYI